MIKPFHARPHSSVAQCCKIKISTSTSFEISINFPSQLDHFPTSFHNFDSYLQQQKKRLLIITRRQSARVSQSGEISICWSENRQCSCKCRISHACLRLPFAKRSDNRDGHIRTKDYHRRHITCFKSKEARHFISDFETQFK